MSYGVMASKAAQVQVEHTVPGERADQRPRRADRVATTSAWTSGRLVLTSRHLSFNPASASPGVGALTFALADVIAVEVHGRIHQTITFHTSAVTLRVRVAGTAAFHRRALTSVEANRRHVDDVLAQGADGSRRQVPPISSTS